MSFGEITKRITPILQLSTQQIPSSLAMMGIVPAVTILLGVRLLPIRIPNLGIEFAPPHRHRSMTLRTDPVIGISLSVIKYARDVRMSELVL